MKTIKERECKSIGIISKIMNILENTFFGSFYFEVGLVLRNAFLLSSIIFASEVWVNVKKSEIKKLQQIDENLLRKLVGARRGCPIELLYLIFGLQPIKFILQMRRIMFLHYILQQEKESILSKVFYAMVEKPVKNDWVSTVTNDLIELNINLSLVQIKQLNKDKFRKIVKEKSRYESFRFLKKEQQKHSKSKPFNFNSYEVQDYFLPDIKISNEEKKFLFAMQSSMIEIKGNFSKKYKNIDCETKCGEEETMEHILDCKKLNKGNEKNEEIKYEHIFEENLDKK